MTKFEEDLNKKMDLKEVPMYFTQSGCSITRKTYIETNWIFDNYKNWHSDEEFQAEKDARKKEYEIHQDIYSKTSKKLNEAELEIANLKSQLQQQALPVVPECVGNFLSGKSIFKIANGDIPDDVISWVQEQTYYVDLEKIISHLIILKVTGFTVAVEKPQLFYLKHIDMSKADKECDYFAQIRNDRFEHESVQNNTLPGVEVVGVRFTQAEIDSMETGSYEQIEVTE